MDFGSSCARQLRASISVVTLLVAAATMAGAQEKVIAPDEFHAGDRIWVTVDGASLTPQGPTTMSDTVVVREGQIIRFPTIGDISLVGVRRSNVQPYLTEQFGKFLRDPVVHATPLVRIAVLGQVGQPGFYTVPSDILLSDVVMRAGGPGGDADLNKTVVKRGTETIIPKDQVAQALTNGRTLDDLRIAPGDEVVVGQQSHFGLGRVLQIVGVTSSVLYLVLALSRH